MGFVVSQGDVAAINDEVRKHQSDWVLTEAKWQKTERGEIGREGDNGAAENERMWGVKKKDRRDCTQQANIDSINRSSDEINVLITSLGSHTPFATGRSLAYDHTEWV